ncbi:MAG: alpha-L-rhamnosidase [Lentisphaeria bacterium]|nr:alpha-L-rhamnosidase [Lentisphaeria bacterium]
MKRIVYANSVADDRVRRYVPPVRVVRESEGIRDSAALLGEPHTQSFVHFNPRICLLPPGSELILDFGLELHGLLTVTTGCMKLSRIRVTFGESVSETLGSPTQDHAVHQETLQLPTLGQVCFGQTAFRFVRLEVPADAGEVSLIGADTTVIYRDWEYRGAFVSDDERLNRIWEVGAYTVHLNCQDYIYDGVKRDRLVWMGDLYPEIRTLLAVFDETALIEKSLDFIRDRTPDDKWMNTASSYSCWWIISQRDLYLYRGNYAYLAEQKDALAKLLNRLLACVAPDGSEALTEWRFLDWSTADDDKIKHAGLQGLLAWTFDCGADLASELNDPRLALRCRVAASKLRTHVPECGGNKIAAAMQVLGGVADAKKLNDEIMRRDPDRGISTFYGYFVLLARAAAGDVAGALDVIRSYWGGMLDFGATTFWEDFDLDWTRNAFGIDSLPVPGRHDIHGDFGKHCYRGLRHSLCHGWAGGPSAFLTEKVLGIRPAAPGFTQVRIDPSPAGLKRLEGIQPTPFGDIELSLRVVGNKVRRSVKLPREIRELP